MKIIIPSLLSLFALLNTAQAFLPGQGGGAATTVPSNSATPKSNAVGKDVAPPNSPVSIWMPPNWTKNTNPDVFDVIFSDSTNEAAVGFKFLNQDGQSADQARTKVTLESQELLKKAFKDLTDIENSGAETKREIAGMAVEIRELKAKFNMPANPDVNGQSVDIAVVFVATPSDRIVCAVFTTMSAKAGEHKDELLKILESLRPRTGNQPVAKTPTPTPKPTPKPTPTAPPKPIAVGKDVSPSNSPVSIWMPSNWSKDADPEMFDVTYSETNSEAVVGFKFLKHSGQDTANMIRESQALLKEAFKELADVQSSGSETKREIAGMKVEYQELKAKINMPANPDVNGQSVDMAVVMVTTPSDRVVCAIFTVLSNKSDQHEDELLKILENLRPKTVGNPVTKAPTPPPTATPKSMAVGKDMAPPNSPVSIWIPNGWTKEAKAAPFDLGFSAPREEVKVGFTFLQSTDPAAATLEGQKLFVKACADFTDIEKYGNVETVTVGGMPADFQQLKGRFKNSANGASGDQVDMAFAIVKTPSNRFVFMMVVGLTSKVDVHKENTVKILENLRPK